MIIIIRTRNNYGGSKDSQMKLIIQINKENADILMFLYILSDKKNL